MVSEVPLFRLMVRCRVTVLSHPYWLAAEKVCVRLLPDEVMPVYSYQSYWSQASAVVSPVELLFSVSCSRWVPVQLCSSV